MHKRIDLVRWVWVLPLLATLACGNITLPSILSTPTPLPPPTPQGNTLTYRVTPFSAELRPGDIVPGTQLEYRGWDGVAYSIRIDGQEARRVGGNALDWRGVVAPGVFGVYSLRMESGTGETLRVSGSAEYTLLYPQPQPTIVPIIPVGTSDTLYFDNVPLLYIVPEGGRVPGTDLVYKGQRNNDTFILEGASAVEYPDYRRDDTVLWEGTVRPGVFVRYRLRIEALEANGVRLRGSAEFWIETTPGVRPVPQATLLPTLTPSP
jgi:hypothetical protein